MFLQRERYFCNTGNVTTVMVWGMGGGAGGGLLSLNECGPQLTSIVNGNLGGRDVSSEQLLMGSCTTPTSASCIRPPAAPTTWRASPCGCFQRNWRNNTATRCTSEDETTAPEKVGLTSFIVALQCFFLSFRVLRIERSEQLFHVHVLVVQH